MDRETTMGKSLDDFHPGDKVTGIVVGISTTEIYVGIIGGKYTGYIPCSGLIDKPIVGKEIEAYVVQVEDEDFIQLVQIAQNDAGKNAIRRSVTTQDVANSEIYEICDIVYENVLIEVQEHLSQMKPGITSSIIEEVVHEIDGRYASRIEKLENRISKLERCASNAQNTPAQKKASANSSGTSKRVNAERISRRYGAFRFDGWIYYPNEEMGDCLYRVREDGTENTQLTDYSVWQVNRVEDGYLYYEDKSFKERKLKLS